MSEPVERVDRDELSFSRREVMAGSSVVAGAAVAGVMPSSVAAQAGPTNEISGHVDDNEGNAVGNATVIAVPHDTSLDTLVTTTDANGDYIFNESALYAGDNLYHVVARSGSQNNPERSVQNYPFILANGGWLPDSVSNRWPTDEGTGTTLRDSIGSDDASISGASWVSGDGEGGFHLNYDGTDDISTISSPSAVLDSDSFTALFWTNPDNNSNDQTVWTNTASSGNKNWAFAINFPFGGASGEMSFWMNNADAGGNISLTQPVATNDWQFFAASASNGSQVAVYHASHADSDLSVVGSQNYDQGLAEGTGSIRWGAWGSGVRHYDGAIDDSMFAGGTALSQSKLQTIFDQTKGNYS